MYFSARARELAGQTLTHDREKKLSSINVHFLRQRAARARELAVKH
jgi:hypothetical protein